MKIKLWLKKSVRRAMLGLPLLVPTYGVNLAFVYVCVTYFHFTTFAFLSVLVIGDIIGYLMYSVLSGPILVYYRKTGYYSDEELKGEARS